MFYDVFLELCAKNRKSPSGVARTIGLSNAAANGWKKGKIPTDVTMAKLADFFDVPVSTFTEEAEKTPTHEGERQISDGDMMFALWGNSDEMDQADLDDVKRYADYVRERKRKK